jgi:predicted DNA-binding protein with PD1-like motif
VRTTAEILLVRLTGFRFSREFDPRTGFPELSIHPQA